MDITGALKPHANPLDDADAVCLMSATALAAAFRTGHLSPVEATRAALARAEQIQPKFNAFTLIDHEGALEAAQQSEARWRAGAPLGPLDGVPATIKDIVWVAGWPARYGSLAPAQTPTEDAPAVALLRAAGCVLFAQTTTPEFGWKALTDSPSSGITRNPWNEALTPGGSSGGAAVAAATGAGALHLGSDGGGSIRIPAAFTGIVGHKPTFGMVPAYPASAFGTVAHIGPMTRTVEDAALMLDAMSGRDLRDWYQNTQGYAPSAGQAPRDLAGRRIGVWAEPAQGVVDKVIGAAFAAVLDRLEAAGAVLEPVRLPGEDLLGMFQVLWFAGAAARLRAVPESAHGAIDPGFRAIAAIGAGYSAADYIAASGRRAAYGSAFDALMTRFDALVSPATAVLPFAAGLEVPPDRGMTRWTEWAGFSFPVNLAQAPACVVPCGMSPGGLPIGVQIVGARGDDRTVLGLAAALAPQGALPTISVPTGAL